MSVTFATPISPVSIREDRSMMKTTIFKALALGLLSNAWVSGAAAGTNCPAFNTAMVDATYMAADVSGPVVSVEAMDDPSGGTIECTLVTDGGGDFIVSVTTGDIELVAHHPDGAGDETELRTRILLDEEEFFTPTQLHACRGEVLQSFVWNQHCASVVE